MTGPTGKIFVYGELSAGPDIRTIGDKDTFTAEDYGKMLKDFAKKGSSRHTHSPGQVGILPPAE